MPRYVVEGLAVIATGLLGLVISIKLWSDIHAYSTSMLGGGEIYIAAISLVLIAFGAIYLISRRRSLKGEMEIRLFGSGRGAMLALLMLAYVGIVPVIGYLVGSLCFFPLSFYMAGMRDWRKSIPVGVVTAILFYLLFFILVKLPLPRGRLMIW